MLAADVRNALDLSLPQVGLASTVFTLGMGVAGIPTGYLLGMSRKSVTLVGLVIFSAATYLTAYSRGLPDLLLYRFVSGLGEAMQLDRPAGHRHELLLPAPRGRRQLVELHLRHRRHHRLPTWAPPSPAPRTGKCPSSCSACPASSPSY